MACKFNAPNGKPSKLFNDLTEAFGEAVALKNWAYTNTAEFQQWFGNSKNVDANGEPTLNELNEFTNEFGESTPLKRFQKESHAQEMDVDTFTRQIEHLTAVFEKEGLNIEVTLNGDLDSIGSVVTINGKTKFAFNPRKIRKDSVFHEYGHTYVDMIGYNSPIVQRGIEYLKGSELWNKVARIYPELSEEALGKEVLTTAIGIEASKIYDERAKLRELSKKGLLENIRNWKIWFKAFVDAVANKLGIGFTPARRLAFDLTSGKLRYTLTHKPASYVQKQKMTIEDVIADNNRLSLTPTEENYMIDKDDKRLLERATTAIERLKGKFDREGILKKLDPDGSKMLAEIWADKREEGTGLHLINEQYILQRNEGKTRDEAIAYIMDNIFIPENAGQLDKEGVRYYSGMKKEYIEGYVSNIADFLDTLFDKGYKLYPEVKVFDEEMGVAGTIDLLIVKPDGKVMIYDFKTKEVGKFNGFYANPFNKKFLGVASDVEGSTANGYSLQLSTYKLILERKGFTVDKLAIIPFEGDIQEDNGEFRYTNVKLYEDHNTKADPDKVLPIDDLTEVVRDAFLTKEDMEQQLENEEEKEKIEEALDRLQQMDDVSKWLEETIVSLRKSISRFRATAAPDHAERYEERVRNLLEQLMDKDELRAVAAYTAFITKNIAGLYGKFIDGYEKRVDDNGNTYRIYRPGYDNMTWEDIKLLEETDKKAYMEFLAFMINADMFLEQAVTIRELPYSDARTSNMVLRALKQNESSISNLQKKLKRLNKELDKRYIELSSNPLYGGRGALKNTKEFFKAQADESFMQRHFDALADSHNAYMANVVKMYDYKMRTMQDDVDARLNEWNEAVQKLEASGSNVDRFIDKTTGRTIDKVDTAAYMKAKAQMFRDMNKKYPPNKKGKRPIGWRNEVNAWFAKNSMKVSNAERTAIINKMKAELGSEGYKAWLDRQTYVDFKGNRKDNKSGAFYKANPKQWQNKVYASYTQAERDFHTKFRQLLVYLTEHMKESIVRDGYAPSIPINDKSAMQQMLHGIGWRESGVYDNEKGVVVNEAGEIVHFLPNRYNNLLKQKKMVHIDKENMTPEELKAAYKKNDEIRKENVKRHAEATNLNLKDTIPAYIRASLRHKHKKAMEFELLRVKKSYIDNHKIKVTKGGVPVVDKFKKQAGLENNNVEKSTRSSKTLEHYEDWLRMVFYEQFENDEGTLTKLARVLQNYTSFKGMAINPLSALNNQVYGSLMSRIEGRAAQFFDSKEWNKASTEYLKGLNAYFKDNPDEGKISNKQNAIIHHFNILMDFKETAVTENQNQAVANRALRRASALLSKAYMLEHASEHNLQNRVLIAMMMSHKVIDGKIVKFDEYMRGKLEKIDPTDKDAKRKIAINKKRKKDLKAKWDKKTSLYESTKFEDGKLTFPSLDKNEIAEFERRVLGVNQYLHGIYNKDDAGAMQKYAIGRLAIQFRKWMRPGWTKRFGNRFGEENWNERRSVYEEGIYVTTGKFIARPIIDNWKKYSESRKKREDGDTDSNEAVSFVGMLGNIMKDYGRFLTNVKVHWHTLNDAQKANVIRTLMEYATLTTAVGVLYALKSIKGEDDDPPMALMIAIYQLDRTVTELTTYVPLAVVPPIPGVNDGYIGGGWLNESKKILKSPTATFNTMESIIKIGREIMLYPFASEEETTYQGGVYHGQSKIKTQIIKMIPIYNQLHRWNHLSKNYKYYKLF